MPGRAASVLPAPSTRQARCPPRRGIASGTRCALAIAAALASPSAGCLSPLLHPLRATDGPVAEIASTLNVDAGRRGACDDGGANCAGGGNHASLHELELSVGYAHVFDHHWGVMGGAYVPAPREFVTPAALWSFFTVQNEFASAGLGPEVGLGAGAIAIGGELQPWGDKILAPRFGAYARWFFPFSPEPDRFAGRSRSWQVGARLRFAPLYLGYAFQTYPNGVTMTSDTRYAQSIHLVVVGLTLDVTSERAFEAH